MKDSIFWRVLTVVAVVGLFYVGHGLHNQGGETPVFDIASPVQAQGVGMVSSDAEGTVTMASCSPDGKTLYLFSRRQGNLKPVFLGSATARD